MNIFRKMTRLETMVANNAGWTMGQSEGSPPATSKQGRLLYRQPELEILDAYMENRQYEHLKPYDPKLFKKTMDKRDMKPKLVVPLPEIAANIFKSHISSEESRLNFVDKKNSEKTQELKKLIEKLMLWEVLAESLPSIFATGSGFLRFWKVDNTIALKFYPSKYCYPNWDVAGNMIVITIRMIYDLSLIHI